MNLDLPDPTHKTIASSDEALLAMIAAGDPEGMSLLYDLYAALVYAIGLHILRDAEAAERVLHDVFLAVWRNPDRCLTESMDLATCLVIITSHHVRRAILPTHLPRESTSKVAVIDQQPSGLREELSTVNAAWKAVYGLTTSEQLLLELAFLARLPLERISTLTGEPVKTIRLQMKNTLLKLREIARKLHNINTDLIA